MTPKQLAREFYEVFTRTSGIVEEIFRIEGCGYCTESTFNDKGIIVHFMFRGEEDYSLLVPWEYVEDTYEDTSKVNDYYKRFRVLAAPVGTVHEVSCIAESFAQQELQSLAKK